MLLLMLFGGSAQAESISLQAGADVVAVGSNSVRLTFEAPPDLAHTSVTVFTANHQPVDIGPLHTTGDPLSLSAALHRRLAVDNSSRPEPRVERRLRLPVRPRGGISARPGSAAATIRLAFD